MTVFEAYKKKVEGFYFEMYGTMYQGVGKVTNLRGNIYKITAREPVSGGGFSDAAEAYRIVDTGEIEILTHVKIPAEWLSLELDKEAVDRLIHNWPVKFRNVPVDKSEFGKQCKKYKTAKSKD